MIMKNFIIHAALRGATAIGEGSFLKTKKKCIFGIAPKK
jgi:hypothetical protein